MTTPTRTTRWRRKQSGLIPCRVWLTPAQAKKAEAWSEENTRRVDEEWARKGKTEEAK